jgi:hypothetical protein
MVGRLLWLAVAACLALPAGAGASVLYVGDSLGVGTSPYLRERLDGTALSVDAEIGRPSGVGADVLRAEIAPEHEAVIFDLGTNDDPADPGALAADLAEAREIAGDRCLIVATLNRPPLNGVPVDGLNRAVTSFASRAPNVELVDWHAAVADDPGMLIDGVHADAEGYALRASLFADALGSCSSPGGFGSAGTGSSSSTPSGPLEHESGDLPPPASAGRQAGDRDGSASPGPSQRERRLRDVAEAVGRAVGTGSEFG